MKNLVKMTLLICHLVTEDIASFIHVPTRTNNYLSSRNNLFSWNVTPDPPSCNNNSSILVYERRFFNRFAFLALRCCENIYDKLNINQLISHTESVLFVRQINSISLGAISYLLYVSYFCPSNFL